MCKIATLNFSMGFNIVAPYMVSATPEHSPPTLIRNQSNPSFAYGLQFQLFWVIPKLEAFVVAGTDISEP